jgi:hypothetical protein
MISDSKKIDFDSINERLLQVELRQQAIIDRENIIEVMHRYARGWDRFDAAAIDACFFSDSTIQFGDFNGPASDFTQTGMLSIENVKAVIHQISNIQVDISGDKAVSECYYTAHHRRVSEEGEGEENWFLMGRYVDQFEKRSGEWRILHRLGLQDCSRTFYPADNSLDMCSANHLSQRKPEDPIYDFIKRLDNL